MNRKKVRNIGSSGQKLTEMNHLFLYTIEASRIQRTLYYAS
jgi:hypothetical protein